MSELVFETPSQFIKWFDDASQEIKFKHAIRHIQSSPKLSKSQNVGDHITNVLNSLSDHDWLKVATILSESILNSSVISPVVEDMIEQLHNERMFASLLDNDNVDIDEFNHFFSKFVSIPDRAGNILQTTFPKFLRLLYFITKHSGQIKNCYYRKNSILIPRSDVC